MDELTPQEETATPRRGTMRQTLFALLEIARPKQWVKNFFVFAPLLFAQQVFVPLSLFRTSAAFLLFCLFASCVYMINDIADLERDQKHPEKRTRPLPSGRVSVPTVRIAGILLFLIAAGLSLALSGYFFLTALAYMVLNLIYSFWLRSVVILDGMFIAAGFVLRIVAGAVVIDKVVSDWLYICAIFVSLFLAFCKRRHEILLLGEGNAGAHRSNLKEYSTELLDEIISIVTCATIVTYALYCIDETSPTYSENLKLSIPFVIYGLFRYLYLVHRREEGGNPTELLLSDRPLLLNGFLWLAVVFWVLYSQ
jgi:4-hydroxybenzoate polyprenyltransferase